MSRRIERYADSKEASEACGWEILELLETAIATNGSATLAISGGSSPKPMFELFARTPFPWSEVHIFWVDERCVPPADSQSNFKLANDSWLSPGKVPPESIHRVRAELPPEEAAEKYVSEIRTVFKLQGDEMPRFDVIHRGMGPDAHTASLFPGEPLIENHLNLAGVVWVEKMKQHRVTLLPGVLEAARNTAMLVGGADKAEPLAKVLEDPYDPRHFPVQIATRKDDPVVWFVDEAAAANLPIE